MMAGISDDVDGITNACPPELGGSYWASRTLLQMSTAGLDSGTYTGSVAVTQQIWHGDTIPAHLDHTLKESGGLRRVLSFQFQIRDVTPSLIQLSPVSPTPSCAAGTSPAAQTFAVWNGGLTPLHYTVTDDVDCLDCTPSVSDSTGDVDTITATYSTASLAVARADQEVVFPNPGPKVLTDSFVLAATGGGSGNPVTFAVGAGPALIAAGNTVSFTGTGSVTITASQAGNDNWNAAPDVPQTFTVMV